MNFRKFLNLSKIIAKNLGLSAGRCRYTPTCSDYAHQAFQKYGLLKGAWLSGKRLLKCHPWSRGGYDALQE